MLKLYNTLHREVEAITPLKPGEISLYSCGPTVYDHAHIGNMSSYIFADTLRRALVLNDMIVTHAMNYTDVDDKTIRRSRERYPELPPIEALSKLTAEYIELFLRDMQRVGNDVSAFTFLRATETIAEIEALISDLHKQGFAYIADDGVYFSIEAYTRSGKVYGQLLELTTSNTSESRIQNDEYDKESVHDFALWKKQKEGEPAWEFTLDGKAMHGRPGWHIECSVMSRKALGQPFDIHTGGIDLIFPHHENEIAQSTALQQSPIMATVFAHNNHILVDGKKMAKSAQNFFTLEDLIAKGYDPLAFRMLVLQAHYRNQVNFTWESLTAAANRLQHWREVAALRWQTYDTLVDDGEKIGNEQTAALMTATDTLISALSEDLNTPAALHAVDSIFSDIEQHPPSDIQQDALQQLLDTIDAGLGLGLQTSTPDISDELKQRIVARTRAREEKNWEESDRIRAELDGSGIILRDTEAGVRWSYKQK